MSTYSDVILGDSPVGYWRLDEASGNPQDSSGNGHHATSVSGLSAYSVASVHTELGTCITFNDGVAVIPDDAEWDLANNFSYECWMKTTTNSGRYILSKANDWIYLVINTDHKLWLYFWGDKQFPGWHKSSLSVDDGNWHHIVVTVGTSSALLYIDGSLDSTFTIGTGNVGTGGTADLTIGRNASIADTGWIGQIDEVAIYDTVLTSTQVTEHYNAASPLQISTNYPDVAWTGQDASISAGGSVSVGIDAAVNIAWVGLDVPMAAGGEVDNAPDVAFTAPGLDLYQLDVLRSNPLALWLMDTTDQLRDITGNGWDLIRVGTGADPVLSTGHQGNSGYKGLRFNNPTLQTRYSKTLGGSITGEWSLEFWIKPYTASGILMDLGGAVNSVYMDLDYGVIDGVSQWYWRLSGGHNPISYQATFKTGETAVSPNNAYSNAWHHIAIVSYPTGGGAYALELWVDGALDTTGSIRSAGDSSTAPILCSGELTMGIGGAVVTNQLDATYDDVAMYDYALSEAQIYAHVFGYAEIYLDVDNVPNITLSGPDPTVAAQQNISGGTIAIANVVFQGWHPILNIAGFVGITADPPPAITWAAEAVELISQASQEQNVTNLPSANFAALNANVITRPDELTFVLIDPDSIEFTAFDSTFLDTIDFGVLFQRQEKIRSFRLGNTSPISTDFTITAEGLNSLITDNVEFSLDKATWEEELTIGHVGANSVTDVIYVRLSIPEAAYAGAGSFVISVVQDA